MRWALPAPTCPTAGDRSLHLLHYFVDYQERPYEKTKLRWVDRLVPDGTWSGNLFDFYRRVYRKLVEDLEVPFALKGDQRQDDTPVHEALREALVNTLVHADYTGRVSVLVVKRPDLFGFRNPGGLRLPLEQVLQGGTSDCRNRLMHQMFLLMGLGERGGSGIPCARRALTRHDLSPAGVSNCLRRSKCSQVRYRAPNITPAAPNITGLAPNIRSSWICSEMMMAVY